MNICNYCQESLITPFLEHNKLVEKSIDKYLTKDCKYSFLLLKTYVKSSLELELYIKTKYPDIYNNLGPFYYSKITNKDDLIHNKNILLENNKSKIISSTCDFCKRNSCEFHCIYGGFLFYKCIQCNIFVSKCGWCNYSNRNYFCLQCLNIVNNNNYNKKIINMYEYLPDDDLITFLGL